MQSIEVRKVSDEKDLKRLRNFMLQQPQFYPNYHDWLDGKCLPRIEEGRAEGLLVIQDGLVVGDAVYQLIDDPSTVEIRNFRIDPGYRNRSIGRFILRQVEIEGALLADVQPTELSIVTDVSTPNFSGVEFFVRSGFQIIEAAELYIPGQMEYVMQKTA